jgi:hypothetical protein
LPIGAPPVHTAEIAHDGFDQRSLRTAATTEPVEIYFVQDHRIRSDQLLALQAVDHEVRRLGEVELGELCADRVQPFHGTHVVVLVMADEHLLGDAVDGFRIERHRLRLIGHKFHSRLLIGLGERWRARDHRRRYGGSALDEVPAFIVHRHLILHSNPSCLLEWFVLGCSPPATFDGCVMSQPIRYDFVMV